MTFTGLLWCGSQLLLVGYCGYSNAEHLCSAGVSFAPVVAIHAWFIAGGLCHADLIEARTLQSPGGGAAHFQCSG
jgi:hypothetical protein